MIFGGNVMLLMIGFYASGMLLLTGLLVWQGAKALM